MTKPEIAQLIRQANNASDPEKRQNLIDAIPKIVEPYYTIQNGVVTEEGKPIEDMFEGWSDFIYDDIIVDYCEIPEIPSDI